MKTTTTALSMPLDRKSWEHDMLVRLRQVVEHTSFSKLSQLTGVHPETVRRYLHRGRPSVFFVAGLCRALDISPEWMLFGVDKSGKGHRASIEAKPTAAASRSSVNRSPE